MARASTDIRSTGEGLVRVQDGAFTVLGRLSNVQGLGIRVASISSRPMVTCSLGITGHEALITFSQIVIWTSTKSVPPKSVSPIIKRYMHQSKVRHACLF